MTANEAKESVVKAGIRLVESGLIARTWGNVSCRISESSFVITPSGRDYLTLTADEIVTVEISDCSYSGSIKPSSEKGLHAETYILHPEAQFVIHTHQDNASVVGALGLDQFKVLSESSLLGTEVICAEYGLPGTKKLRRGAHAALLRSHGNAIIMKNHGALCFGKDYEEAFSVAKELEIACENFMEAKYLEVSHQTNFDSDLMRRYSLSRMNLAIDMTKDFATGFYCEGERTDDGFTLHTVSNASFNVKTDKLNDSLPKEAVIFNEIFKKYPEINNIEHSDKINTTAVSCADTTLRPLLDDFAQIVGTHVKTVEDEAKPIVLALGSASAVLIRNNGAYCCGSSSGDATAVSMIMEKGCKSQIGAAIFGHIKPINRFECALMRFIYLKKYSKQASVNK
jgi:L-fuculose-phosphate aldolase